MWLLPALSRVSRLIAGIYYRLSFDGAQVPPEGPVLLVGNHPNSLLDPALLAAAANRPVRFLAKSGLFDMPHLGWLMRAVGSIPVYRRMDDPSQTARNTEAFTAAEQALAEGSVIGIFPEGISHDLPSLAPLKTGAARIALGAARRLGRPVPIVPVGLVFRDKPIFRSAAVVVVGEPVAWDDLAERGPEDAEAVRELTRRIEDALRSVTLNLEEWEDLPLVAFAEDVWTAEHGAPAGPGEELARQRVAAARLAALRRSPDQSWRAVAEDLERHRRKLAWLHLHPDDLTADPGLGAVARWSVRTFPVIGLLALGTTAIGVVLLWIPYKLTGMIAARTSPAVDTHATYKALIGTVVFVLWWLMLSTEVALIGGWAWGAFAAVMLPLVGLATLRVTEQWRASQEDARRFLTIRRRRARLRELAEEQRALAARLNALLEDGSTSTAPGTSEPLAGAQG